MKIAILSRSPKAYSTNRLREAALERGHEPHIIDVLKVGMYVEQESPQLTYRTRPLPAFDAVIPRIGASVTFYGAAVVRHLDWPKPPARSEHPRHALAVDPGGQFVAMMTFFGHDSSMVARPAAPPPPAVLAVHPDDGPGGWSRELSDEPTELAFVE